MAVAWKGSEHFLLRRDDDRGWRDQAANAAAVASNPLQAFFDLINAPTQALLQRPLIGNLLENEEYKALYHEYLQQVVDDLLL